MLAVFAGGFKNMHEVTLITSGIRYTLGSFWDDRPESAYPEELREEWKQQMKKIREDQEAEKAKWQDLIKNGYKIDENGNTIAVDLRDDPESWVNEILELDFTTTYDYLLDLGEDVVFEEDENGDLVLPGFAWLLEQLEPSVDKAAGIYSGTLYALAEYVYNESTPWDASAAEPFPGATEEVWKITAAFEKGFLQHIPLVPMSTLDSAVVYADNVVIEWPLYAVAFGWGAARYRYLNTDADFADGFYNSYEVAFLATLPA
jgi:hypothetical protein